MSWDRVESWLAELRRAPVESLRTGLSPQGNRLAWEAALGALTPEVLDQVREIPGVPYASASFVAASTVFTAPLEWLAVLLGRGTSVALKPPAASTGPAQLYASAAQRVGLPLHLVDRDEALRSELVIAMGKDSTMSQLADAMPPSARFLAHGHRFSVAWLTDMSQVEALVDDLVLYDTRGCFSPQLVFTPLDPDEVGASLAHALARAQDRTPLGDVGASEGAAIRAREALARVLGRVWSGDGYSVHRLPAARLRPEGLPRSVALAHLPGLDDVADILGPWDGQISTLGTDLADARFNADRVAPLGQMQRPPVQRVHDGRDWLRATLRSSE